jgi:hypothetical protein
MRARILLGAEGPGVDLDFPREFSYLYVIAHVDPTLGVLTSLG